MIFGFVRMKANAARSKIATIISAILLTSLFVSIPIPANAAACTTPTTTTIGADTVLAFTTVENCDWSVPAGVASVWVVAVGGGGAAGAGVNNQWWGAGGGGGQVTSQTISVSTGNTVAVSVGAGGTTGDGSGSSFGTVTANGGKTPLNTTATGGVSGSGMAGGSGTSGTTIGGGGGGAWKAAVGINAGEGLASSITGTAFEYGGGGNGYNSVGTAGTARSGAGSYTTAALANRGGGGSQMSTGRGAGGSGVVIVRFLTQCNPDSAVVGTQIVVSFTDIGTCNWTVPTGVTSVRALVVAGGGAGGGGVSGSYFGAGGGGGEVLELSSVSVSTPVSVTVGAGGIKSAYSTTYTGANLALRNGSNSSFGSNTARGGKTPINSTAAGGVSGNGNSGTSLAGGTWGNGGSGAAAGAVAQRPGAGVVSNISGTSLEYGGGGDGNNNVASDSPRDGAGTREVEALPNRGGGGSIMPSDNYGGGAGGSGVVIVSYASASVPEPVEVPANCRAGVGIGGLAGTTANQAGHGCVLIKYSLSSKTYYQSFNYTGSDQSWTSPNNVTSLTFYLLGAGGGADNVADRGPGGSGGFATGTYAVSTPTAFTIIVGQGGNGNTPGVDTYGGGGKADYASGGGRSAIRLASGTEDLITAGGAGGGGHDAKCGGAGGGTTGQDAVIRTTNGEHGKGGTQTTGGAGGYSVNTGRAGVAGGKYQGGLGRDESGGGGGGFYGGGGGGDNIGAGGGSGYFHPTLITSGRLVQGTCTTPGNSSSLRFTVSYNGNNNTSGTAPTETAVNAFTSATLATNSGTLARTRYTFSGWNTRADGAGTTYTAGQTNFTPPGDLTLFALWNSTITYNANGATGTVPTAVTTSTDASRTFNLNSGSGLTRTGLNFAGWNTAADGSGFNYLGGASYTSTGTTTLFAIFRPTYSYDANGATGGTVPASTIGPVPGAQCFADSGFNNCRVFSYTGSDQEFTLPTGMDISKGVLVEVWGAGGGGSNTYYNDPSGGAGGYSKATITTPTAGEVLKIVVGQGGLIQDQTVQYGGGGIGGLGTQIGSSGGGYSGIFTGTTPLVISGGGGGVSPGTDLNGTASGGGGANQNGGTSGTAAAVGRSGTSTAGGAGATGNTNCASTGSLSRDGSYLQGGAACGLAGSEGGGGGGGGYYGGGGGTYQIGPINGGGGGGSGYLDLTRGTLIANAVGSNGVLGDFAYSSRISINYANNAGRGGKGYTNTVADNSGGNGLITIQWSSSTVVNPVATNSGNLTRTGYKFAGWNTSADGNGTSVPAGSSFPSLTSTTLFAAWEPDNSGPAPTFNTNTTSPIGVLASTAYVINTVYTDNTNDLVLSQYADKIQIIASVPSGTLAITTTTNLTLPIGYQSALNTAAGTISFIGNLADVNAALATLRYTAPATAVSTTITITASYAGLNGDYRYNAATGSYYWRGATAVTREAALTPTTAASNCGVKFNGMCGYMIIPNNDDESLFAFQKLGSGWIGISKPNHPTLQYVANAPSGLPTTIFTFWSGSEGGLSNEPNIAIHHSDGRWVDVSTQTYMPIYEFGGKSETVLFGVLTRTIAIGALAATGTPTLATASDTGTSNSDKITNDNTPTINIGGLTVGATVTLTATPASGPAVTCTFVATTTTGSCTFPTMADGTYSITSTQTLGGTTTAASAALSNVVIDATRPTVTLTSSQIVSGGNRTALAPTAFQALTNQIIVTFSESVSGFLISEITKAALSTGWAITTDALTNAVQAQFTFNVANATGAGGTAGILKLSVLEGVASDVAGNTNTATASDFVINTLIQVRLTNEYDPCCVIGGNNELIAQTTAGGAITLPGQGTLARTGHTFAGWSLVTTGGNGAVIGATYTPTVPVKLYSSWTPNVYVVTYNANGGNGAPATASQNFSFGGTALVPSAKGTLARTGYTFDGWSLNTAGTGTIYSNPSDTVAGTTTKTYTPTASITMFAKWTPGNYTLTLDRNGSTGTAINGIAIVAGTAKSLAGFSYTRDGYTLLGWNSLADGTGTSYAIGSSVTFFADTTLYANWGPRVPGVPTVAISGAVGNTQITVSVTGAALSGTAGPATSYLVTASPGSSTCTITVPATTCTFTGLTNGTAYTFTAVARNTTGNSAASASSAAATPLPWVVNYVANSGTVSPTSANFNLGTPLTLPLPTRSGYTFAGWYAETGLTTLVGNNGASYSPTSTTTTLYAKWTGVAYTITYNGNGNTGGAVPASGSYTNGDSAYVILGNTGTLVKTGYTFAGWYTNATGTGGSAYAAAASYSSAANIILFAKWDPVARTVTYNLGSGTGTIPTQLTGRFIGGTFATAEATGFSRSGFAFAGWSDGTNVYAAGATYTVAGTDVVLTAQWTAVSYSVTFLSNGATSGTAPTQANLTAGQKFVVPANPFTKTGFDFTVWNDGTSNYAPGVDYTMTAANTVLVAQWTPRGFTITYNGNENTGGSAPSVGNYVTGSPAYPIALNTFAKSGHVFTGWSTTASGSGGTNYAPGSGFTTDTANLVLYARWTPATYTITYNGNGANNGTAPTTSSQSWTYSSTTPLQLSTQGTLEKTGFTFTNWATTANATVGVTSASPEASTTYYAVWTATQYTVTYAAGTGATGNITSPGNKTLGQTFTLDTGSTLTPPATVNSVSYSFGFWSDGTKTFRGGATYVMPADNVILTANWIAIYKVTYNPNGGTTTNASPQKAADEEILIGAAATRTGYTFVKWQDQSPGLALWNPGETTTVTATRFIFSAQWTANNNTITYDGNGKTGGSVPAPGVYVTDSAPYAVLGNTGSLVRDGYTFMGWNTAANGSGTDYPAGVGATYSLPDNLILYAKWQPGVYTITYNGNGATGGATPSNGSFTTGGSYSIPANSVGKLSKTGFTFASWSTAANGGGDSYADAATTLTTTSDVILYAKWSAASHAVTYVRNGATSDQPTQSDVQYGSTFTLAAAATQAGKNFIGWSDGTNTYGGGATYTMGTAAVTLTAQWQDQVYAVTYNLNGGSGTVPTQSGLASGGKFTVATPTNVTKTGYTFAGWNTGSAPVAAGAEYTMTANNLTLTAVWTIAAPASPSSVSAASGDGSATITVAASSSGGAPTSFVVTASPAPGTCTVISPATSCVILGLTNGTAYTFSATATNATGTSTAATSTPVTPAGKPDAPTGVNAVSGNGSATVSFTAPTVTGGPAISSYTVTASPNGATCTVNAPATSCVVPGLTNGTAYTFAVTANNGLFTSSASSASTSVVPATVPGPPTTVTAASTTSGSATVTFTAPSNNGGSAITGYTVTPSPATVGASCTASGTSYTCTGLTNGTPYTFAVVAVNNIGNSTSASNSTPLTPQGAASAPTTISAVTGDSKATVTFSGTAANGSTITGYTVKAYDSTGNEVSGVSCTVTTAAANASCEVTGLTNGSSYTFKAITNSTANSNSVSSAVSIATSAITPAKAPDAPTGVQVTAGTGKISVSWTEPASNGSAITSYTVTSSPGGFTCTVSAPATTCDVSTGLVAGTNYTFQVTATSLAGTSAASTASTSIAVNAAPSAPINVTAVAGNASANVSWDPPVNINGSALTGYTVTAYTAGNIVSGSCTTTASVETCLISGLTNGTAYTFVATATNSIGTSLASTASSAVTPSTVPNAPTGVSAAVGDAEATVSFIAPVNNGGSAVLSYTVTSSPGNFTCTVNAPATSCKVTGLSNGTAYTFTVKARNTNGESPASTASAAGTPVLSSKPTVANDVQPSGNPYVGSTLTAAVTFNGSPTPTITYQWRVCESPTDLGSCKNISGATSATYVPTISEVGKYIVVDETASNRVGDLTETSSPTQVINPEVIFSGPSGTQSATVGTPVVISLAAAGGVGSYTYTVSAGTMPAGVSLDPSTGQISGTPTTAGTYTFTVRAADSNGVFKEVVVTITVAAAAVTPAPTPTPSPTPPAETCDSACQASRDAAATKAAADKAAADALAKAAADKAAADAATAAKAKSDAAATTASTKATADAAAAAAAAKAAVERAADAAAAKIAADKASADAAARAKAAADAQTAANKAAADAAAALRNSSTSAAAKAAATAAANKAAADAQAAVRAAATAAQEAAVAKNTAANANKQVDIAINSLNSRTAASQASAQANAIAAAAKAAANEAAAAAETRAAEAKAAATAAQRAASTTAARIATEQKEAATAAALAKVAADAAAKATAEKIATANAAKVASEALLKVLEVKAALAQQAAKTSDETVRSEIAKKLEEIEVKAVEAEKIAEEAATDAEEAVEEYEAAVEDATEAKEIAETQAAEAEAVKAESATKTAAATKAVAAATVAAKVATAAKAAAAKVPSKAVIATKPSTSTNKNSATATVTGLKPGQKVKVTVNVRPKP